MQLMQMPLRDTCSSLTYFEDLGNMLRTTVSRAFDAALANPIIIDQIFYDTLVTEQQPYLSIVLTHATRHTRHVSDIDWFLLRKLH
jgi:hypothetical protein